MIVRATKKLRQRLGSATPYDGEPSTTLLGEWYATLLPWRPQQLILVVNEKTLLPVVMPLAPGATAPARIGPEIAAALATHQAPSTVIDGELSRMRDCRFGPTANRSVIGIVTSPGCAGNSATISSTRRSSPPDLRHTAALMESR